jgi:hypothetical protein
LAHVVHGQPITFPEVHRGEEPHRIVGHRRGGEDLVVGHLGGGQRGGDITAIDVLPHRLPIARRARTIVPSSISSAAAAEVSGNSWEARSRTFK